MIKQIVKYPNGLLRQKSTITTCSAKLIQDLKDTMKSSGGIGLSAIQIGMPYRVFVTEEDVYINPIINYSTGSVEMIEGCLSLPGVSVKVIRSTLVKVSYQNAKNEHINKTLTGIECRIFLHEMDHLEGKLISDYR